MLKVGLIGIGGMGFVHYGCYKSIEGAQLVAVADVRTDVAKEKVGEDDVKIYSSYQEMIEAEDLDMVDICTPSYMHKEMAIYCLRAGLNVLCEKPMALNSADCDEILAVVNETGKRFMVAHVVRFMQNYMYLKSVIDSGELGDLRRIMMRRESGVPRWSWEDWMRDLTKSGGTPIDLSIHDLDYVQYCFGRPNKVVGMYQKYSDEMDMISTQLIYDGFTITADASWNKYAMTFMADFIALFNNGMVEIKEGKLYKNGELVDLGATASDNSANTGININAVDGYGTEIQYFVDCITSGKPNDMVTPESSRESVAFVEDILKVVENI